MKLLTYEEALQALHKALPTTVPRRSEDVSFEESLGNALAEPIYAREPYPRFDNSAVDGYCIAGAQDAKAGSTLHLVAETKAGAAALHELSAGNTIRILTGAPLPHAAYAVVMQEDVERSGSEVTLAALVGEGANIRKRGADFEKGEQLLSPGVTINPGHVALFASQGIATLRAFAQVTVGIIATGDEIVEPNAEPAAFQLRDSNSAMLAGLVARDGHDVAAQARVGDSADDVERELIQLAGSNDVVLLTGGASVGDYDFVAKVVAANGTILFHGVNVRPGKPILAGKVGDCLVFGLPGNPASAFVGYHIFVRDSLRRIGGHAASCLRWVPVQYAVEESTSRDDFVRCTLEYASGSLGAKQAHVQGSFGLRSLGAAQALVRVPAGASGAGTYDALLI